jgi:hypothetical protein
MENPKDLLKLIHYAILAYNFAFMEDERATSSKQKIELDAE